MSRGHDPADGRERADDEAERETDDPEEGEREADGEPEEAETRPPAELRWVQIREPRHAVEIGRNGRVLDSKYHERWDAWEVLLETYEGEVGD